MSLGATADSMERSSDLLVELATSIHDGIHMGLYPSTQEIWTGIRQMGDSAASLLSAAIWLRRHIEKYETQEEE
jgi:hypothetical protein